MPRRSVSRPRPLLPWAIPILLALLAGELLLLVYLNHRPGVIAGQVLDAATGDPIPNATLQAGVSSAVTDADGRYQLTNLSGPLTVTAQAGGYLPAEAPATGGGFLVRQWQANLALIPNTVPGRVQDAETGEPLAGVAISASPPETTSDAAGRFVLRRLLPGATITAIAVGYLPATLTYTPGVTPTFSLIPTSLIIRLLDAETGQPLPGAVVRLNNQLQATDVTGQALFRRVKPDQTLQSEAEGYLPQSARLADLAEGLDRRSPAGEIVTVTLQATRLTGRVIDEATGLSLPSVRLTLSSPPVSGGTRGVGQATGVHDPRVTTTDNDGRFVFRLVPAGAFLSAQATGYISQTILITDHALRTTDYTPTITVALSLLPAIGSVQDRYNGFPVVGATVAWAGGQTTTDASGSFVLPGARPGITLTIRAAGFDPLEVPYRQVAPVEVRLTPHRVTIAGTVRDDQGRPVVGATVALGGVAAITGPDGRYRLENAPGNTALTAKKPGYTLARLPLSQAQTGDLVIKPFVARGLYMPYGIAMTPERSKALIALAVRNGLNAIVVDVKSDIYEDVGRLAYKSELPLAKKAGTSLSQSKTLTDLLKLAKEKNLYTIARIMVFKDDLLARNVPGLAVLYDHGKDKDKTPWIDDGGSYWVDPYQTDIWEYNIGVAKEMAALGFDEVQFDYIRFPSDGNVKAAVYPNKPENDQRAKWDVIEQMVARMQQELVGVYFSIDTFGWTVWPDHDEDMKGIGQRFTEITRYVDYISPMIYPSTFQWGSLGYDRPPAHAYEVVKRSTASAIERINAPPDGVKRPALVRPWIQDFPDYAFGVPQTPKEVADQIKGVEEAGATGWLVWSPSGEYYEEGLRK